MCTRGVGLHSPVSLGRDEWLTDSFHSRIHRSIQGTKLMVTNSRIKRPAFAVSSSDSFKTSNWTPPAIGSNPGTGRSRFCPGLIGNEVAGGS
jgi:hypothetical protein